MSADELAPELRERLSRLAQGALAHAGITSVEDLSQWTEAEILNLHGVGPKSLPPLRQALAEKGLSLGDRRTQALS